MIQEVTIKVDVPDGYEATGEWRQPNPGEPHIVGSGEVREVHVNDYFGKLMHRLILRKKPDPVGLYLQGLPASTPEGLWIYRACNGEWKVTNQEPMPLGDGYCVQGNSKIAAHTFFSVLGHDFVEPEVNLIQIKRPAPSPGEK